jgi:hypothetical protein
MIFRDGAPNERVPVAFADDAIGAIATAICAASDVEENATSP